MLFKGVMVTQLSGSLGGVVAAHNRGGPYFRNRAIPTDPATTRQLNCRTAMADAYTLWASYTDAERQVWTDYAAAIRRTNRIGDERGRSGWNEFCRWAVPRLQANAQLGTVFGLGEVTPHLPEASLQRPLSGSVISAGATFRLSYDPSEWWTADQDNALLLFLSSTRTGPGTRAIRAIRPTINFFIGPYELATCQPGDPDGPLSGTLDYALPVAAVSGERVWWRARLTSDDHGMSTTYSGVAIAP